MILKSAVKSYRWPSQRQLRSNNIQMKYTNDSIIIILHIQWVTVCGKGRVKVLGRFSNTVNVDVNTINCHGHSRTNFRTHVDRVFPTRPGRLTRRDADVPVHVFLTLIFEFVHTSVRSHASCTRAVTAT